ncbi:MAG: glycosyltransferase WbsX family protein [Ginsengibacter sp.]
MDRRSFLNQVGISSLTVASAAVGINNAAEAGSTFVSEASKSVAPKEGPLRLSDDLTKMIADPSLLQKPDNLVVACYTFPNYHPSAIHNKLYGPGWTEYNLLRPARPWFEGHQQPRGPLLGELDESKPGTWEKYNTIARQHGIDVLIWDWYWYDGKPALHEALENGFLKASNKDDVKFACMWTNHPWYILFPTMQTNGVPKYPPSYAPPDKNLDTCWQSMSYIVSRYFHLPNYWKIDGKPVLCIWDPNHLEKSIGITGTKKLIADLRAYAKSLGHEGIHIHASGFYSPNCKEEGYDTSGSYNPLDWSASRFQPKENEICDYERAAADVVTKIWPEEYKKKTIPYIPAVAPGWDSTPRYIPRHARPQKPNRDVWPGCTIFKNESPAAFKAFVQASFAYLNQHKDVPSILTVACFNEWTEGHYLLPDNRFGYGMLDALAEALGIENTIMLPGNEL